MSRVGTFVLRVVAPVVVVGLATAFAAQLVRSKPKPSRAERPISAPLVEVMEVTTAQVTLSLDAMGAVRPARVLIVQPQVSGAIVDHHPALVPGGLIHEGDGLVTIDERDYQLAIDRQQAQVARARLDLRVESGRQTIASREWETLSEELTSSVQADEQLARREPQVQAARAGVQSARGAVRTAQLNLDRTRIFAPFNAVVREEGVEVGQVVGPGYRLATLVGTDAAWVEVSVPVDALARLVVPGHNAGQDAPGSATTVTQKTASGTTIVREGRVVRMLRDLDPLGRMARVIVEISDPMDLTREPSERRLPLLVGAFVAVQIQGSVLSDVVAIPREALRDGDVVWVSTSDGTLAIRTVAIAWRERTRVLVDSGLQEGDRVILSPLAAPVSGMTVRTEVARTAADVP